MVLLLLGMGGMIWVMVKVIGLYMAGEDGAGLSLTALKGSSWGGMAGVGIMACLAASFIYALVAVARSWGQLRSAGLAFLCVSGLSLAIWVMIFVEFALGINLLWLR
jgi:hypothetical protein